MNKKFLSVALFGALLAASTGTFTSCKDYDDDINSLQEQVDSNKTELADKLATLQAALDAAKTQAEAAQTAADKAQSAADDAAKVAAAAQEAIANANIDAINKAISDLQGLMANKVDQSVYDAKMDEIDAAISAIEGRLDNLETAKVGIETQITALENFQKEIEALGLKDTYATLLTDVKTVKDELKTLQESVNTNTTDIATVKEELTNLSDEIDGLSKSVEGLQLNLNTLVSLLSHRLTSMTFAPTQFINGIEVINFATLEYTKWDETKLPGDRDVALTSKTSSINDGKTQAVYYVNPTSVAADNIKGLTILSQDASNTITRAADEQPIILATIDNITAGKMTVNLKKNIEGSFNKENNPDNVEHFTMVALQANIELTAEEEKNGVSPTVVSDWARLAETSATPYIHYAAYDPKKDEKAEEAHFYNYADIHDGKPSTTDGQFIVKRLPYKPEEGEKDFDLHSLVNVCDKNGNVYDAASYGLKFEFTLPEYTLKDQNEQETDQAKFAHIDENGVITSQSNNGTPYNKDAIGREPLIQVLLRNTANDEVVDVRYFKIAWTSVANSKPLDELESFTDNFACGKTYTNTVLTNVMNDKVYTVVGTEGISKEEFHALYALDTHVYSSPDAAKEGAPAATTLGTIEEIPATGSTTTYNLKWTYTIDNITKENYEAGEVVRTVYGRYYRKSDAADAYTFSLTLRLKIAKMELEAGYNQTYWSGELSSTNASKSFQVNPALTSDAEYGITNFFDCQIIADMLKGYNKNIGTLTSVDDLVSNADVVELVFDADRVATLLGQGWSVSSNGTTLSKGGVKAATIDGSVIALYEETPSLTAHSNATTAAQELLGKNVPVKLSATNCAGISVTLDQFEVNFISPLKLTLAEVKDSFKDLITGGSTISVKDIATITEAFGLKRVVWEKGAEKDPTAKLVQWYDVKGVTWDLANATTNLIRNGQTINIGTDVAASKWSSFADKYELVASPNVTGATSLTFKNNGGAHVQQSFQIAVPVYVQTKWAPKLADPTKTVVVLTVNPGDTE